MFYRHYYRRFGRMLNAIQFLHAVECGIFAAALYRLIQPGMIFGFWGRFLARRQWDWPSWVRAPLGECLACFAGQIGLWSGIILAIDRHFSTAVIFEPSLFESSFGVIFHTCTTIVFANILHGRD